MLIFIGLGSVEANKIGEVSVFDYDHALGGIFDVGITENEVDSIYQLELIPYFSYRYDPGNWGFQVDLRAQTDNEIDEHNIAFAASALRKFWFYREMAFYLDGGVEYQNIKKRRESDVIGTRSTIEYIHLSVGPGLMVDAEIFSSHIMIGYELNDATGAPESQLKFEVGAYYWF